MALIESQLLPKTANPEGQVFFYKMKGDYYRYISEYTVNEEHKKAGDCAHEAYKTAQQKAS